MVQRGRKKGASGEQSRALLLATAAKEFAENGYHDTKISTIVKRASFTQPSFYLYFHNKEAVFQELEDLFRTKLVEFSNSSRLEHGIALNTISERIGVGLTRLFTFFVENPDLTRIGFFISPEAEELKRQVVAHIEENLIVEVQAGYFRDNIDTNLVAESLMGIIVRLTFSKLLQGLKEPEDLAHEIVHLLLYGLINSKDKQ